MNKDTAPLHIKRSFAAEIRAEKRADGALPTLHGYAAVFNSDSEDMGGWVERIAPGAFEGTMTSPDIYALWNHDPNYIIAATADGSLRLSQDGTGLLSECEPMDTQIIRDLVVTPIQQGKVRKMSFAFDIPVDGCEWIMENGRDVRVIRRIARLYDVSPVAFPAYPGTDITARTMQALVRAFPRAAILSAMTPMNQQDCEDAGGEWDETSGMCNMEASAGVSEPGAQAGRTTSSTADVAEFYRRRLGLHERLRFSENLERKYQ